MSSMSIRDGGIAVTKPSFSGILMAAPGFFRWLWG